MPLSLVSRVNEKLYHADLLLEYVAGESLADRASRARYDAIQGAVVATLYSAWLNFIEEIASSCQIDLDVYSLDALAAALMQQGRSMAVVTALQQLQFEQGSWLAQLESAYQQFQVGDLHVVPPQPRNQSDQIVIMAVDDSLDLKCCLEAVKGFIEDNRRLLSEW